MYQQMTWYADDERTREMELAAAEAPVGCSCYPLGRMVSRAIMKCNGREGRIRNDGRLDYAMAHTPAQTCYVRPTAHATVSLATASHRPTNAGVSARAHAMLPEAPRSQAIPPDEAFGATAPPPPGTGARKPRKNKKSKRVRFTPSGPVPAGDGAPPPHPEHAATVAGGGYHLPGAVGPSSYSPAPPAHGGQSHGYGGYGYGRYAPSPLARWEMLGTPRRPEYFSGEYRWYYPTPVRERIYSIATDANRLTAIFSEENPNACTIV